METTDKGAGTIVNPPTDRVTFKNTWRIRKSSLPNTWEAKGAACAKASSQQSHQCSEDGERGQAPAQGEWPVLIQGWKGQRQQNRAGPWRPQERVLRQSIL